MRVIVHRRSRGATLVEALVAMAVMAFGMLAIVGVQQTLRVNSDLSKQRNEATRLAEQEIERVRADAGSGEAQFDAISLGLTGSNTHAGYNTTFTLARTVTKAADDRSLMTHVLVKWLDRTGAQRQVVMHDMLARVDPMLSGLVRAAKPLTPVGRKNSRHPTIPGRAQDFGDGTSVFKPIKSGTIAWVFDNSTGAITHTCIGLSPTEDPLTSKAGCTSVGDHSAQLLAGEIRFNLRGGAQDLGTESVLKPVASGEVAWVIDHATKRLVRICPVSALDPTAALTAAMVSSGCTNAATHVPVAPFAPTDSSYVLVAADAESPDWPSIPATVERDTSVSPTGINSFNCHSDAKEGSFDHVTAAAQKAIEYFCIIIPTDSGGWGARTKVKPVQFSDGGPAAIWATGTSAGQYRVCRYTTASTGYTANFDHPDVYAKDSPTCGGSCRKVTGNLINQNFLIIDGTRSCPTDVAADPAGGDLVNSNTLQHQPS
jgi:Tfp pilus assembly protein PilV